MGTNDLSDEEKGELTEEELKAVEEETDDGPPVEDDDLPDDPPETPEVPPVDKKDEPPPETPAEPPAAKPIPGLTMPTVSAYDLAKMEAGVAEAKKKFDDGEVSYEELSRKQRELDKAVIKNEMAAEINKEAAQAGWRYEQQRFWDQNKAWAESPALSKAFMETVNVMIAAGDGKELSDEALLREAQKRVVADFEKAGFRVAGEEAKKPKTDAELVAAAKRKAADRSRIPADLKDVPPAGDSSDAGEFGYLDKLSGEAFEKAVMRMTPEQLERYEAAH